MWVMARAHGEGHGPVERNSHLCHAGYDQDLSSERFGYFAVTSGPSLEMEGEKQLTKLLMKNSKQNITEERILIFSIKIRCFDVPEHHSSFKNDIPG